jgi:hypothetical protein
MVVVEVEIKNDGKWLPKQGMFEAIEKAVPKGIYLGRSLGTVKKGKSNQSSTTNCNV